MDYKKLTSACGIDCFNCELFEENVTPELQQQLAQYMKVPAETVKCLGCRVSGCFILPAGCQTKECITAKGVEFCYECDTFPCSKLQPSIDGAERYPQNFKLFNLCRIQKVGLEEWATKESTQIRKRYKQGKIVVGGGPKLGSEV